MSSIIILFIYLKHEKEKKNFMLTNKKQESDEKYVSRLFRIKKIGFNFKDIFSSESISLS